MFTQPILSKIRSCFDYRVANLSRITLAENGTKMYIEPGAPWDILWAELVPTGRTYTLTLRWKGRRDGDPFTWEDLTLAKVVKTLKFYRG